MLFSKLIVLSSFLVSASVAIPISPSTEALTFLAERGDSSLCSSSEADHDCLLLNKRGGGPSVPARDALAPVRDAPFAPAGGPRVAPEYWMRDVASGKNCVSTEQGTLCSYTTAEVEAYNAANPGVSDTLAAGCVKHIKGTTCLYPIDY